MVGREGRRHKVELVPGRDGRGAGWPPRRQQSRPVPKAVGFGTLKRRSKRRSAHGDKPHHVRQKVEERARIGVFPLMRYVPAGRDRCGGMKPSMVPRSDAAIKRTAVP